MKMQNKYFFFKQELNLCATRNASIKRKEFDNTEERVTSAGMWSLGRWTWESPLPILRVSTVVLEVMLSYECKDGKRGLGVKKEGERNSHLRKLSKTTRERCREEQKNWPICHIINSKYTFEESSETSIG